MTNEAKGQKKTVTIRVSGMFCQGCEDTIRTKLRTVKGVSNVEVNYNKGVATVTYAPGAVTFDDICAAITALGYETQGEYVPAERPRVDWGRAAGMLVIIAAVYILLDQFGLLKMLVPPQLEFTADVSYGLIFLIGLATSVHCVAMCGGINLSQCLTGGSGGTDNGDRTDKSGRLSFLWPSIQYNAGRVVSYTLLGAAAGAVGSAITFSFNMQGVLKLVAGVFMVVMGVGMLDIFPQVRRFIPKMPGFVSRWVGAGASSSNRGPLVVGLLNGFLPCGPLQAMQVFALSTGSPIKGGVAMGLFSLGTVPLMFGLGTFGSFAGRRASRRVMTAGAVMVAVLGLCMLSQSWNLFGLTGSGMPLAAVASPQDSAKAAGKFGIARGHLLVSSTLLPYTYPAITVEAGRPVRWEIDAQPQHINGCNNRIFIREYGIEHTFKPGKNVIEFTPTRPGKVPYSCWMGMIPGMITVVDAGAGTNGGPQEQNQTGQQTPAPERNQGRSCCAAGRQVQEQTNQENGCVRRP